MYIYVWETTTSRHKLISVRVHLTPLEIISPSREGGGAYSCVACLSHWPLTAHPFLDGAPFLPLILQPLGVQYVSSTCYIKKSKRRSFSYLRLIWPSVATIHLPGCSRAAKQGGNLLTKWNIYVYMLFALFAVAVRTKGGRPYRHFFFFSRHVAKLNAEGIASSASPTINTNINATINMTRRVGGHFLGLCFQWIWLTRARATPLCSFVVLSFRVFCFFAITHRHEMASRAALNKNACSRSTVAPPPTHTFLERNRQVL